MSTKGLTYHTKLADYFQAKDYFFESVEAQRLRARQIPPTPRSVNIRKVIELPWHRLQSKKWSEVETLFTDLLFLESKAECGRVFDLVTDYSQAVDLIPSDRPKHKILRLLVEALRRDIHFIARHPTTIFQCLWNSCWWYDCPSTVYHYRNTEDRQHATPFSYSAQEKLSSMIESWLQSKKDARMRFYWLRSLRPPPLHLGAAQQAVISGHDSQVDCVMFGQQGQSILSYDGVTIRMWDAVSGRMIANLGGNPKDSTLLPAFLHDGESVITGLTDGIIRMRDIRSGREMMVLRGHTDSVTTLCTTQDSRVIISGSLDQTVRVWDAGTGRQLSVLKMNESRIAYLNISPCGRHAAVVGGNTLFSNGGGNTIDVIDIESGKCLVTLRGHKKQVREVCFSPDGKQIATAAFDGTLGIWNLIDGQRLFTIEGHWDTITSVCYSPDGQTLASGSYDKTIRIWDTTNGKKLMVLHGHEAPVYCVRFSEDGKRIVSGSGDQTVRIWNPKAWKQLKPLQGHEASINCLSFSPNGQLIASAAGDILHHHLLWVGNKVGVWNVKTGSMLAEIGGHEHIVTDVRFSTDGKSIVSVSGKTKIIWDVKKLRAINVIEGSNDADTLEIANQVRNPYRLLSSELETVLKDVSTDCEIAWLPGYLKYITTHPSGRLWAGARVNYLALFRLEGVKLGNKAKSRQC